MLVIVNPHIQPNLEFSYARCNIGIYGMHDCIRRLNMMGLIYRKRVKLFPGVRLNLSKTGISTYIVERGEQQSTLRGVGQGHPLSCQEAA